MNALLNPSPVDFLTFAAAGFSDVSELMVYTDCVMETPDAFLCAAFPPRSGKTTICQMLAAYYSSDDRAAAFFASQRVARTDNLGATEDFRQRLLTPLPCGTWRGRLDVIHLNIANSVAAHGKDFLAALLAQLGDELLSAFPEASLGGRSLRQQLHAIVSRTGRRFYFIIDDWDAPFLQLSHEKTAHLAYLDELRRLFKSGLVGSDIAGAFLAGVLPPPKMEAAPLSNFQIFSTLEPELLGRFFRPLNDEPLPPLESFLFERPDGLKEKLLALLAGDALRIEPRGYCNQLTELRFADAALTLLVHFGFLTFDLDTSTVKLTKPAARQAIVQWLHFTNSTDFQI